MGASFTIARVTEPPDLSELLAASLEEGHLFVRRLIDDFESGLIRFDRPGEALFVARGDDGRVIGVCGLNLDPFANDPAVGRVRHLYVLPAHRHRGVGRALLETVIAAARPRFSHLHLRTHNPHADALYRAAGFLPWSEYDDRHARADAEPARNGSPRHLGTVAHHTSATDPASDNAFS